MQRSVWWQHGSCMKHSRTDTLSRADLETILAVTRALAAPFDLPTMLAEVAAAAQRVLRAERSSVWLYDATAGELVVTVASDLGTLRIPAGRGLVGACARDRQLINVPDCHADARFDASVDRLTGFYTRCSLTLPLIDDRGELVGVLQLLNKHGGVFSPDDEALGLALAAQCAVALSRVRMTAALLEGERLKQELQLARAVQQATLPAALPRVAGYAMQALFLPADLTGGDTYDLALIDQGLLLVLADATGHGIAPALSVTRMQAMLRTAFGLGASLEVAFRHTNDQLALTLPDGRFVTAFVGLLDPAGHCLRFLSGGQGPILHYVASQGCCTVYRATSFPLGAAVIQQLRPAVELAFEPGDWLLLLSDGVYEQADAAGDNFGRQRVEAMVASANAASPAALADQLMAALRAHAGSAPQEDDITAVLLKRLAADPGRAD